MFPYEYSTTEKVFIDVLNIVDYAKNPNIVPVLLYREMALLCFKRGLEDNISKAIRRGLKEIEKVDGIKRLTPEWEKLITYE